MCSWHVSATHCVTTYHLGQLLSPEVVLGLVGEDVLPGAEQHGVPQHHVPQRLAQRGEEHLGPGRLWMCCVIRFQTVTHEVSSLAACPLVRWSGVGKGLALALCTVVRMSALHRSVPSRAPCPRCQQDMKNENRRGRPGSLRERDRELLSGCGARTHQGATAPSPSALTSVAGGRDSSGMTRCCGRWRGRRCIRSLMKPRKPPRCSTSWGMSLCGGPRHTAGVHLPRPRLEPAC